MTMHTATGFVIPVGDGAVGKTCLSRVLNIFSTKTMSYASIMDSITKTKNLEFEFIPIDLEVEDKKVRVMAQFLVPPGQKSVEGDTSRSYEQTIEIYRFYIKRIDLVLLTFNLINSESFDNLEFWISAVNELCNDQTNFLLLGTHLDLINERELSPDQINIGLEFIKNKILMLRPGWKGTCNRMDVSILTGQNLMELRLVLAKNILSAQGYKN